MHIRRASTQAIRSACQLRTSMARPMRAIDYYTKRNQEGIQYSSKYTMVCYSRPHNELLSHLYYTSPHMHYIATTTHLLTQRG